MVADRKTNRLRFPARCQIVIGFDKDYQAISLRILALWSVLQNLLGMCFGNAFFKRSVNLTSIIYNYSQMATGVRLVDFGCGITTMPRYEKESSLASQFSSPLACSPARVKGSEPFYASPFPWCSDRPTGGQSAPDSYCNNEGIDESWWWRGGR